MASTTLTTLLDLRRAAEEEAKRALAKAVAILGQAEAEQTRLEGLLVQAQQALASEKHGSPTRASVGLARERFRQALLARREQARAKVRHHQEGPLARARLAESQAAEALRQAGLQRQAAERLHQRQQAEQRKQAERRDEQRDEDWVLACRHQKRSR